MSEVVDWDKYMRAAERLKEIAPRFATVLDVIEETGGIGAPERKDNPPRDTPLPASVPEPVPFVAPEPTAAEYRALLVKHRRTQLRLTADNLQRLAQTYDRAAEAILEKVRALPDGVERTGTGWLGAQLNLLRAIDDELTRFRSDYGQLLDLSMLSTAQQAADRESEVARLVGAPVQGNLLPSVERTITLTHGVEVTAQFGVLARDTVEALANRYYRDGLQLSQRLYRLETETRRTVEDTINQGLIQGTSARDLATQLQAAMAKDGVQTPRSNAMRIARTEINNAHREAHIRSVIDPQTGDTKSYITGVRWSLSLSHPAPDQCDVWAAHDEGLGAGVYSPDTVPTDHPHGLCIPSGFWVTGPVVIGSTSRWYEGEVVDIETLDGHFLTVTPNHPILTPDGWVAGCQLVKGGYVISSLLGERVAQVVDPNDYQVPSLIEDVAAPFGSAFDMSCVSVPTTAEHFHGDGVGSEVCIVRSNCPLRSADYAASSEPLIQERLLGRDITAVGLPRESNSTLMLKTLRTATNGSMGRFDHLLPLFGSELRLSDTNTFRESSQNETVRNQILRKRSAAATKANRHILERLSGLVGPDKIVSVRKCQFAGHVYNLHTRRGWYIAGDIIPYTGSVTNVGGIVVHNCYTTSELKAFPGVGGSGKKPNVDAVPDSQVRYYAERVGDAPAQALLARREG